MTQHQQPNAQPVADPTSLLGLSRKAGRQYAMYFVLLGAAALVAGFLLAVMTFKLALVIGLVIIATCIAALGAFANANRHLVGQFKHIVGPFWIVYVIALLVGILGVAFWKDHQWMGWVGGGLGLLDGLMAGHFVDRASKAATQPTHTTAVH